MQVRLGAAALLGLGALAHADDALVIEQPRAAPPPIDLRLTLSSFLFRETGGEAPPLVEMGAPVASASPVRRYFGDLRAELTDGGFALDARVRQTTSQRYQSGATGGGEYEIRTLRLRLGSTRTSVIVGRQTIDAAGALKLDGAALVRRVSETWSATLFGGAAPQLGSRSLETDYPELRGATLIPFTGGAGASYSTPNVHGDLGAAATYVMQDVDGAGSSERSRVTLAASGYARPARWLDVYHFALVDVAGGTGIALTNGSVGVDVQATPSVRLTGSANHVSTDVLQIAARGALDDPDPSAMGIVQNNLAVVRVAQDSLRAGASAALARARFEVSITGGLRRRPAVAVPFADGAGEVAFPGAKSTELTVQVLDRRSIAKLRLAGAATITSPLGRGANRARGAIVRVAASRALAGDRGQLELDAMAESFHDYGDGTCEGSLDVLACFGGSSTRALQAGALASWRVAREWLVLVDTHLGARRVTATSLMGVFDYPTAYSVTAFARLQWRYR